jgi:outer membrane immunogenic protein
VKLHSAVLAASAVLLSTGAFAADLPIRKEAPPPVPYIVPFSWTGFYVGAFAGGSFGSVSYSDATLATGNKSTPGGFNVGGLIGANYQFSSVVVGAEGEYGYNTNGANSVNFTGTFAGNPYNLSQKFSNTGIGRLRARLGYAVMPNFLLYAAGGWTFANTNTSVGGTYGGFATPFSVSNNKSVSGWNLGVGGEYAFTQNWIGRVEYIYDGFSKTAYNYNYPPYAFADSRNASLSLNTIRAALEYKF